MSEHLPAAASPPRPAWLEQLQRHVEDMRRVLYRDDTACGFDQASQAYQKTRPVCCRDCQVNWFIRELADVLAACQPPAAENTFEGHRLDCHKISNSSRGERYLSADACTCAAASPPTAEARDMAWLLIERWRDGSQHYEGIALTMDAASTWVHGDMDFGQARSSLPFKIIQESPGRAPGRPEGPTP